MTIQDSAANELDFDPDALREKYRLERDKRLRSDGNSQYQEMSGEFDHYTDDPYIDNAIKREPLKDDVEIVIIGGGFGGLISGSRSGNSAMRVSASSRGEATLAGLGTGTGTLARLATPKPTSICRS